MKNKKLFVYYGCLSFLFLYQLPVFGESSFIVPVYMWRDNLLNKTVRHPAALVVTHYVDDNSEETPAGMLAGKQTKLLLKPFEVKNFGWLMPVLVRGQACSHKGSWLKTSPLIDKIIPAKSLLTVKNMFFMFDKTNLLAYWFMRWSLPVLSLMKWHNFRGGTSFYYIVEDHDLTKYVVQSEDIDPIGFYRYQGESAQKPARVLSQFQQNEIKRVTLLLEGHAEYIDKCQYYQPLMGPDQKQELDNKELATAHKRMAEVMEDAVLVAPDHLFKQVVYKGFTVELEVNQKGLALFLVNSSYLRIKDVLFKH